MDTDKNNKRPLKDDDGDNPNKSNAILVTSSSDPKSSKEIISFSDLCDDVVLHIFQYLPHDSLANMAQVYPSLSSISGHWTFWKHARFEKFNRTMEDTYINYLKELTTHIDIKGDDVPNYASCVSSNFMMQLEKTCPNLTHLGLFKQKFDSIEMCVTVLHPKLKSLTIEHSIIKNISNGEYEYDGDLHLRCPYLEDVRITFNDWFTPRCLNVLKRLRKLTYLSLQGCSQFKNLNIPCTSEYLFYSGLRFLQTLDLRLTPISDKDLLCLQQFRELKHILLESPACVDHNADDATITDNGLLKYCYDWGRFAIREVFEGENGKEKNFGLGKRVLQFSRLKIENLYVRNYPRVTDTFLKVASEKCPFIQFLDVTGTSCTTDGINLYRLKRPHINIIG